MEGAYRAKKSLGQNFLTDPRYVRRIIALADLQPSDFVCEIGPGKGVLTAELLKSCRRVVAIELDGDLVDRLRRRFREDLRCGRFRLHRQDVLQADWEAILPEEPVKFVGNLPYNISTRLLIRMTQMTKRFQRATFMVQKEVAERILADRGGRDYGYLTLLLGLYFRVEAGFDVPAGAFRPSPKVQSHVLRLSPRSKLPPVAVRESFETLISAAFRQRRKTIWNNLKALVSSEPIRKAMLEGAKVDPGMRPEQVEFKQFLAMANLMSSAGEGSRKRK
ncbi:MAG TPA: 16S rRNA (adenine(1518)-N(6)/adenine(1519)-N(6))-dimethyltransferase RsmA [Acidobacteriota bacterium]|nr:16S rRNA (adenine(1518)-N(6)/adenine(1519)-N(6))-dimethyltransferase RsmA [Acidobacteriota bacterium]